MTVILLGFFFLANSVSNFSKYLEGKTVGFSPSSHQNPGFSSFKYFFSIFKICPKALLVSVLLVEALSPGPSSYPCPFVSCAESANVLRKKVTVECYRFSFPKSFCLIIAPISSNRCFKHLSGFPSYSQ